MADLAIVTPKSEMRLVRRSILTMPQDQLERIRMIVDYLAESQLAVAKNGSKNLSKGDIALIIFKGLEMGFEPMAALESIDLISVHAYLYEFDEAGARRLSAIRMALSAAGACDVPQGTLIPGTLIPGTRTVAP